MRITVVMYVKSLWQLNHVDKHNRKHIVWSDNVVLFLSFIFIKTCYYCYWPSWKSRLQGGWKINLFPLMTAVISGGDRRNNVTGLFWLLCLLCTVYCRFLADSAGDHNSIHQCVELYLVLRLLYKWNKSSFASVDDCSAFSLSSWTTVDKNDERIWK